MAAVWGEDLQHAHAALVVLAHEAGQAAVYKGAEDHAGLQAVFHILRAVEQAIAIQHRLEVAHIQGPHIGLDGQGLFPEIGCLIAATFLLQAQSRRHSVRKRSPHHIPGLGFWKRLQEAERLSQVLGCYHGDAVHLQGHALAALGGHPGTAQAQGLDHTDVQHRVLAKVGKGLFFLCHGSCVTPSPVPPFRPGPQPGGQKWESQSCR